MARVAVMVQSVMVNGNSLDIGQSAKERDGFLLYDVDKKQQLVDQTIHPPGQERYIIPLDRDDLLSFLNDIASGDVTEPEMDAMLNDTRGSGQSSNEGNYVALDNGDDISVSNVKNVLDNHANISGTTDSEAEMFRDKISFKFLETGDFLLSFEQGALSEFQSQGWTKTFPDDSSGLFST